MEVLKTEDGWLIKPVTHNQKLLTECMVNILESFFDPNKFIGWKERLSKESDRNEISMLVTKLFHEDTKVW